MATTVVYVVTGVEAIGCTGGVPGVYGGTVYLGVLKVALAVGT